MPRPSKLTPAQWSEVERRALQGESASALGREFGVSEAAIRKRLNSNIDEGTKVRIRTVAEKLADAETALRALPVAQRPAAMDLAEKLRSISDSLASAAELGAKTAHRLQSLANSEVGKVDDADPLASTEALRGVSALTKLANDSASIALNLLSANKDRLGEPLKEPPSTLPVDALSTEALSEIMRLRDASQRR